ncbi:hypothetical protein [Streptomyces sp. UNOB3_S3]|uniref:hypothetical protein n=1 Tax=Streptomyces sp. UNOB3_S3 TaxID=2871682 RepID=UPI001E5FA955|nr:hypothetical protein [Streptomyces sp. UNOB3_S3]MCC3777448.1 hypothetical protein [Streptomyces sp. UNOB3_S3]
MGTRTALAGPVTLICDPDDDATRTRLALAAHDPAAGHVAVGAPPGSTARMARDILRALDVTGHRATAFSGHLATAPGRALLSASALAELTERRLLDARSTACIPVLHPDLRFALALPESCPLAGSPT